MEGSLIFVAIACALVWIVYDARRTGRDATFIMVIFLPPLALVGYPWARFWDDRDARMRARPAPPRYSQRR